MSVDFPVCTVHNFASCCSSLYVALLLDDGVFYNFCCRIILSVACEYLFRVLLLFLPLFKLFIKLLSVNCVVLQVPNNHVELSEELLYQRACIDEAHRSRCVAECDLDS